jgi:hypothetical protein
VSNFGHLDIWTGGGPGAPPRRGGARRTRGSGGGPRAGSASTAAPRMVRDIHMPHMLAGHARRTAQARAPRFRGGPAGRRMCKRMGAPPPSPRTKRTRLVLSPVLSGHVSCRAGGRARLHGLAGRGVAGEGRARRACGARARAASRAIAAEFQGRARPTGPQVQRLNRSRNGSIGRQQPAGDWPTCRGSAGAARAGGAGASSQPGSGFRGKGWSGGRSALAAAHILPALSRPLYPSLRSRGSSDNRHPLNPNPKP